MSELPARPNIILINCDDLGYGDLGCYGSTRNHTPYIDRLADEGLRLTDFYMASPLCSPSRGAMLTGSYPNRIGFGSFDGVPVLFPGVGLGLGPQEVTLGNVLKEAGYRTQCVGKWHCGDQPEFLPTRFGFDHYYGLPYSNDMGVQAPMEGWGYLTDSYPPLPLLLDEEVIEQQPDQASLTSRYLDESLRFMRQSVADSSMDSDEQVPFFLYFAHLYVHVPIYVQERFARLSGNGRYGAAVACIDWSVGVLMAELERLGIAENTLVIFTSDNGSRARDEGGSNAPLRSHKATTWEGGHRVPCIMRWPAVIAAGQESDAIATAMDFLPTFQTITGIDLVSDRAIDGRDMTPLLQDSQADSAHDQFLYSVRGALEAIRVGRWKLHVAKGGDAICELYDLVADVGEQHDAAAEHPDVVADLTARIELARAELGDTLTDSTGSGCRPIGLVDDPQMLTTIDPDHPYYIAMYDLPHRG